MTPQRTSEDRRSIGASETCHMNELQARGDLAPGPQVRLPHASTRHSPATDSVMTCSACIWRKTAHLHKPDDSNNAAVVPCFSLELCNRSKRLPQRAQVHPDGASQLLVETCAVAKSEVSDRGREYEGFALAPVAEPWPMRRVFRPLVLSASSSRSVLAVPNTSTLWVASSVSTLWMPVAWRTAQRTQPTRACTAPHLQRPRGSCSQQLRNSGTPYQP